MRGSWHLGLGGNEVGYPPAPFVADFARARAAGLHTVAHAGETTGHATICDSLDFLGVERIGHGVRAVDNLVLVERLARDRVPLELCPTSNLCTGVVCSFADHPFRALDEAGVLVTVNSDDPPLFGTTLTDEFLVLARHWGYDADGIQRIALNAVDAAFLPKEEKAQMRTEFVEEFARLRQEVGLPGSGGRYSGGRGGALSDQRPPLSRRRPPSHPLTPARPLPAMPCTRRRSPRR